MIFQMSTIVMSAKKLKFIFPFTSTTSFPGNGKGGQKVGARESVLFIERVYFVEKLIKYLTSNDIIAEDGR